ncbi:MAG: hypothetical protein LC733_07695 [Actinobacteria bacterium]|nr:hypothetical protein [Actinomycetota bacterium]
MVVARPEVTFHQRFLRRVRSEGEEPWDLLAPAVREGEGGKTPGGVAKRARTHRLVKVDDPPKQPARVSAGSGACLIIRRAAFDRRLAAVGALFEDAYGTGSEDLDLFWWAERQGMVVRYVPTLYVGHAVGQELLGTAEDRRQAMANYRVTVWKHAEDPRDWVGWALGEAAFVGEEVTIGGLSGLRRYAASWSDSAKVASSIKKRRGRLRG